MSSLPCLAAQCSAVCRQRKENQTYEFILSLGGRQNITTRAATGVMQQIELLTTNLRILCWKFSALQPNGSLICYSNYILDSLVATKATTAKENPIQHVGHIVQDKSET